MRGSNFSPDGDLVHRFRRPDSQKTSIGIESTAFSRTLPATDSAKAFFLSEKPRSNAYRRSDPSRFEDTPIHFVKKRESTGSISSTFEARRPFEGNPRGRPKSSPQPNRAEGAGPRDKPNPEDRTEDRAEGRGKPEGRAEGARPKGASSQSRSRTEPRIKPEGRAESGERGANREPGGTIPAPIRP